MRGNQEVKIDTTSDADNYTLRQETGRHKRKFQTQTISKYRKPD